MGWLFGKKDDDLYRGDAPASSPGFDGVQPTAYQRGTAGRPYDSGATATSNPYPTASAPYATASAPYATASAPYPTAPASYPTVSVGAGQPYVQTNPLVPGQHTFPERTGTHRGPVSRPNWLLRWPLLRISSG